jgi:hypothetical protein
VKDNQRLPEKLKGSSKESKRLIQVYSKNKKIKELKILIIAFFCFYLLIFYVIKRQFCQIKEREQSMMPENMNRKKKCYSLTGCLIIIIFFL